NVKNTRFAISLSLTPIPAERLILTCGEEKAKLISPGSEGALPSTLRRVRLTRLCKDGNFPLWFPCFESNWALRTARQSADCRSVVAHSQCKGSIYGPQFIARCVPQSGTSH